MPQSLWDMFQPQDAAGQPASLSDAFTSRSNSLIGLGLGLLAPSNPLRGQSSWGQALEGFQGGAQIDARTAAAAAQLKQHRADQARAQANADRAFARSGESDLDKIQRDIAKYGPAAEKFYSSKTEGDWQIVQAPHPTYPGETVPVWANKRTRETQPFTPGVVPGDTTTAQQGSTQPGAAPPGSGIPPAPPGSDPKEWRKEQTKLRVQQQTAEETRKKQAGMIDPVTEDIDRALAETKQYPGMIAGGFGNLMKAIPGSRAHDVGKLIDTVKANASFDKLQQMRSQSPTGASGLGAVTQGEHKLLQDSIGALDQSQTPDQFLRNLERVKRIRHEIVHGPGTAPPPEFDTSQRPQGGGTPPPPKPGFVKGGYVFKGGDPADESNWAPVRK